MSVLLRTRVCKPWLNTGAGQSLKSRVPPAVPGLVYTGSNADEETASFGYGWRPHAEIEKLGGSTEARLGWNPAPNSEVEGRGLEG